MSNEKRGKREKKTSKMGISYPLYLVKFLILQRVVGLIVLWSKFWPYGL